MHTEPDQTATTERAWRRGLDPQRLERRRVELAAQGFNASEWARQNKFGARTVQEVLSGRRACLRGQMHTIAVMLGLKDGVVPATSDAA